MPSLLYAQRIDSFKIYSKIFDKERNILIYTPWQYDHNPDSKFEVIYVFDAQSREYFDNVHSTLAFLGGSQFPMIVVGVISEERNKDFFPVNEYPETTKFFGRNLGDADKFLNFLGDELIPYIDVHFRTLPKRISVGHSNGGAFITYCLLKDPEIFDAYIVISPNYTFDKELILRLFEKFDPCQLKSEKFIYMCNSDEGNEWISARKKVIALLKSKPFKDKISFINQDFSATQNHSTVYPSGVYNGIMNYFDYQYFNPANLIAYYSELYNNKQIVLNPGVIKQISDVYLKNKKKEEAIKILLWGMSSSLKT